MLMLFGLFYLHLILMYEADVDLNEEKMEFAKVSFANEFILKHCNSYFSRHIVHSKEKYSII